VNPTKQMGVKTNRTSFLPGHRNGHHTMELKTRRHAIGQNEQHKGR